MRTAPLAKYDVHISWPKPPRYNPILQRVDDGSPGSVVVEGFPEDLQTRVIKSCGFCQFDKHDIAWAEPAGLLKVESRLIQWGDRRSLQDFAPDYPDAQLYCVDVRSLESRDAYPMVFAEFVFL